jgi:hypothetical protein
MAQMFCEVVKAFFMPANKNNQEENSQKEKLPLSQTIENAHASGDGAIERDKDTILPPKEEKKENDSERAAINNEAY